MRFGKQLVSIDQLLFKLQFIERVAASHRLITTRIWRLIWERKVSNSLLCYIWLIQYDIIWNNYHVDFHWYKPYYLNIKANVVTLIVSRPLYNQIDAVWNLISHGLVIFSKMNYYSQCSGNQVALVNWTTCKKIVQCGGSSGNAFNHNSN